MAQVWTRLLVGLGLGLVSLEARADDEEPLLDVDLSATVSDVHPVRVDGGLRLAVLGASRTWLVAPDGEVVQTLDHGGHGLAQDTRGALWVCGEDGLRRLDLDTGRAAPAVSAAPCRAVAPLLPKDDAPRLLVAGTDLRVVSIPDDGPPSERRLEAGLEGWPVLAVDGRRFAAIALGGDALLEEGPWGTSSFATEGAVGGLAASPSSWVWSLPEEDVLVDVTRRRLQVAPGPGPLTRADVDGDGQDDLVVAHPDHPVVGFIAAGSREERVRAAPVGVRQLRRVAWDPDPCDELVLVTAAGRLQVLDEPCGEAPEPVAAAPVATPPDPRRLPLGEGVRKTVTVTVGQRLDLQLEDAAGDANAFAASGGPASMIVSSTGTVLYRARAEDIGRWKVAVRLWEDDAWSRRSGFDLVVEGGGEVDQPASMRVSRTTADVAAALEEEVGGIRRGLPVRGCLFGLGGAIGGSRSRSWVLLGEGFLLSGSPALAVTCDGGTPEDSPLWWFAGLDMAPFFVYLVNDTELRHGLSATVGVGYGKDSLYVGAFGTAGATVLGLGPVVRWLPIQTPRGRRHGLETRATWMPARNLVFEYSLLYTMQLGDYRDGDRFR